MNKNWSELNKLVQQNLKSEITFFKGIEELILLRNLMFNELLDMKIKLRTEDFYAMPFLNAKGYHNKTIAYSIWHIFRIEDIVANTLILNNEEIIFKNNFLKRLNSPIKTTGNELKYLEIKEFSKQLNIDELYNYAKNVKENTDDLLKKITYHDLKNTFEEEDKKRLRGLNVISDDESANWLIDYWCNKDIKGLIQMPFSRHWIMHIEACLRIMKKL